jgi:acyl-CoA reductase-like NAD-dependent aldehyde dehydrogenase
MDEHQKGVQLGLRAAATYVECEADDLIERARNVKKQDLAALTAQDMNAILRRIAQDLRELKVTRGR